MELAKPDCAGWDGHGWDAWGPHEQHRYLSLPAHESRLCRGWTQAEADAIVLADYMMAKARALELKPGCYLLAHPLVYHVLMQVITPGYAEFVRDLDRDIWYGPFHLNCPLLISAAMDRGAWELHDGPCSSALIAEGVIR